MGKKGQQDLTTERDEISISRGVFNAYTKLNLRYSQMAPVTVWEEKNTGSNLPAQIEIGADTLHPDEYQLLFIAKGGGSANKTFLYQETKAILNPTSFMSWLEDKLVSLGTSACPPYHLAIVIGGTSAEHTVKTAKLASTKYLDSLPLQGDAKTGHAFRDIELKTPSETGTGTADYKLAMVDLFKAGKIREARTLLCSQARPEEMEEIFRWMYDNLELFGKTEEQKDEAIIAIRKGAANASLVADQEINLSATFTELMQIG